jgi:hypothetical protein
VKVARTGAGAAAWSMQARDTHWFMLSESPTNITVFPRHVLRKSAPSNLCSHAEKVSELSAIEHSALGQLVMIHLGSRQLAGLHRNLR